MDKDSKFIVRKVLIDLILLCMVGFPILFFYIWGKPFERGFFCNDESLMHPFHDSTVTSLMMYTIGLVAPCLIMLITECIQHRRRSNHKVHNFIGWRIPPWLWASYNVIGVFGFGICCQQLTTDIAKYSVGRLRPHFFDVCDPDINCSLAENQHKYHVNFTCRGSNAHLIKEMRLSFPSGHSSFSTFTMIYIAVYVQCRIRWAGSKLLRHGFQFIVLMVAWFTVMSRVSDYKHHWSDVLAGALIGVVTAVLVIACVSDLWKPRPPSSPRLRSADDNARQQINGTNLAPV